MSTERETGSSRRRSPSSRASRSPTLGSAEPARGRSAAAHRATTWGPLAPAAETGWRTLRRDASIGGSVLGAALAYRIFIWLLPFVLALVLVLALVAGRGRGDVAAVIGDAGLTGVVASSVADAADGTSGWALASALVVTLPVLAYESSVLRASCSASSSSGAPSSSQRRSMRC